MLIVEGPDGSGKSTLVRRLSKDLNLPVASRVVSADTTALVDLAEWTERNVAAGFQHTIFDRHRLVSEPIYGPILRPRQETKFLDFGWMSNVVWQFYQAKPVIIYCMPDLRTVWANIVDPDTDNSVFQGRYSEVEAIYAAYINRAVHDATRGVGRLYNYKSTVYADVLGWAQQKMEDARDRALAHTA